MSPVERSAIGRRRGRGIAAAILLAGALGAACAGAQQRPATPSAELQRPTLVVLITVDQLRGDYIDRFRPQLSGGLARLVTGGAWFSNAHHDFAMTETAPGHATLLSGRFPRSTGITANRVGVADDSAALLGATGPGASPHRFRGTTLVDWLIAEDSATRALSVSMKDRGAILPIGRSRQAIYWYPGTGDFTTSRYYAESLPTWVQAFNARRLPHAYAGKQWTLILPDSAYAKPDSQAGTGSGGTFPKTMPADSARAASAVRGTPWMDELTVAFALEGVRAMNLGAGPHTDVLAVSLSAMDLIGHSYGPDSREVHDGMLRLDRTIGQLIDSLYRLRDSSRVVFALSADHGVGTMPEVAAARGDRRAVRIRSIPFLTTFLSDLRARGVPEAAVDLDGQLLFVDRQAVTAAGVNADSMVTAFRDSLIKIPGVRRVDRYRRLLADTARDPIARRWAHQMGDTPNLELVMTLDENSLFGSTPASHGSPHDYDTHVPLIFYGPAFKPGRHRDFVRTVDLAPTLAARLGVRPLEKVDGVVLRSALE